MKAKESKRSSVFSYITQAHSKLSGALANQQGALCQEAEADLPATVQVQEL